MLLVKVGTEPGLERIPTELKLIDPRVRTFGVLSTPEQTHNFDEVVTSSYEAILGAHNEYFSENLYLRPEIYSKISIDEGRIVRMYERVAIHDLTTVKNLTFPEPTYSDSINDRFQLFLRQAAFWDWAITKYQIHAIVAQNYGHVGWDAVLQSISKARQIPYLFFHEVRPFTGSLYIHEQIEQLGDLSLGHKLINEAMRSGCYEGDSAGRLNVMRAQIGLEPMMKPRVAVNAPGRLQRILVRVGRPRTIPTRLIRSMKRRQRTRNSIMDERQAMSYEPLPITYAFCELQSQPNATTAIKGWMVPDQRELIAMVARHLPVGWSLVVRESDRQWSRMYPRRRRFWSQIAAVPRVVVAKSELDSGELMRDARFLVETSYSTLLLNAIQQGKPAVVFGYTHIASLPNIFSVMTDTDVEKAIQEIVRMSHVGGVASSITRDLVNFAQRTKEATLEGALSSIPNFGSEEEKSLYVRKVARNVAIVIAMWLKDRVNMPLSQA